MEDMWNTVVIEEILEKLKPYTTPKKALQLLESCPSSDAFIREDSQPVSVFIDFLQFIINRRPSGTLNGIWEELMCKTLKYSRNFNYSKDVKFWEDIGKDIGVDVWLSKCLNVSSNCPNPYIRLELFRLYRLFKLRTDVPSISKELCVNTFMETVSEIQPHLIHLDGDVLFGITDLNYIFLDCGNVKLLRSFVSFDINKQLLKRKPIVVDSIETKFMLHCIQLIGIFATMAATITDPEEQAIEVHLCICCFTEGIRNLVDCGDHFGMMPFWQQFSIITADEPLHQYVIKAIRELTSAINNLKQTDAVRTLMPFRDEILVDLFTCSKTNVLPNLLLSRQIQGYGRGRYVQHHALLLNRLSRVYNKKMAFADEDSDAEDSYIDNEYAQTEESSVIEDSDMSDDEISVIEDSDMSDESDLSEVWVPANNIGNDSTSRLSSND